MDIFEMNDFATKKSNQSPKLDKTSTENLQQMIPDITDSTEKCKF